MAAIDHGSSASQMGVDTASKAARAILYDSSGSPLHVLDGDQTPGAESGFVVMGVNARAALGARADRWGSFASALHTPVFHDSFESTVINPIRWSITATTMAAAQTTAGGLLINSAAITTVNTGYMLKTAKSFMKTQRSPMQAKFRARLNRSNNSVMEIGFGDAATFNGANTSGAYWQVTSNGVIQPVLTYGGVDRTGDDVSSLIVPINFYTFDVMFDDDEVVFCIQDTSTGLLISRQVMSLPLSSQRLFSATQMQALARVYNTAVAPAPAPQMVITDFYILSLDALQNKPWSDVLATMDRGPSSHPFTGAQLAQWANSAEPANAALSNTAAGYTTLGGRFRFAAVAGAATDYALFGFAVPSPANLVVTGIDIETWNTGADSATTPTLLNWAVGVGSTAVSLATATVNRIGIGAQSIPVGAPQGALAGRISKQFRTPLHCAAGRFFHIILRMPVGTATASQVIAGMVNVEGYFE